MALKKDIILDSGIEISEAYIEIDRIEAYKDYVKIHGSVYISKLAKESGKSPIKYINAKIDQDNSEYIPLAYAALKTVEGFEDATDY